MTHTAGLTYGRFEPGPVGEAYRQIDVNFGNAGATLADMARKAASVPLCFQPGSKWTYSVATDVLGRVVEVVAGKPLDRVFEERILGPLGMVDTAFGVPQDKAARTVACYERSEEHTSELQSLMRISYAVFCLKKKTTKQYTHTVLTY